MALIITIDGTTIQNPTKPIVIGHFPVTAHVGRVASGDMTMDYVTNKKTFQFEYEAIRADVLKIITDIIFDFPDMFHTLIINEDGGSNTYTIYPGAITKTLLRSDNNNFWYWKDVSVTLIER